MRLYFDNAEKAHAWEVACHSQSDGPEKVYRCDPNQQASNTKPVVQTDGHQHDDLTGTAGQKDLTSHNPSQLNKGLAEDHIPTSLQDDHLATVRPIK
ncbi:hypothetical protein DPEC_G00088350 [Dallia pectoralis]|uniref:Uncharacterized protein n=1 Tax=Dallia pectoralis TaxID=75939 RepID=A0ACC2H091_DALPE|nr:hypothetical protein DPEC_G00088350 [Dallia pectoralis]